MKRKKLTAKLKPGSNLGTMRDNAARMLGSSKGPKRYYQPSVKFSDYGYNASEHTKSQA